MEKAQIEEDKDEQDVTAMSGPRRKVRDLKKLIEE